MLNVPVPHPAIHRGPYSLSMQTTPVSSPAPTDAIAPLIPLASIPVFFTPRMVANAKSFSPSPMKPGKVVNSWLELDVPAQRIEPGPVTRDDFVRVHAPNFVDAIFSLELENGCGTRDSAFAESLRWTSGAMLAAAQRAMANGQVAVAPVSGFHHAGFNFCGGFCTFNGLMVAAGALFHSGRARRVGILDFDQHWGDGTQHIMERLGWQSQVVHYSPVRDFSRRETARAFLLAIPKLMERFATCDVVLYQAGADPHVDDPLGGWLTTDQLFERDQAVFETLRAMRIPIAWNLAGGYQEPLRRVLDIHDNTMRACGTVFLRRK